MKSPMNASYNFSQVPSANIQRSVFNRSMTHKTTFDGGYIIPVFCDEILPGDTVNLNMAALIRMSTPQFPIMDNIKCDVFNFYCPTHLLQTNFKKLMGEQTDPGDSIAYLCPTIDITGATEQSLPDYFGLPTKQTSTVNVNSYLFRMYNFIYNEWFRPQNLVDSVVVDLDDGPDSLADYVPLKRAKRHDYFTSCATSPQKGDAVELPLGNTAPIAADLDFDNIEDADNVPNIYEPTLTTPYSLTSSGGTYVRGWNSNIGTNVMYADLTSATAVTVNQLRQSFQIQKLLERDMLGGTRYIEKIQSHFGVRSPNLAAIRPVYLGGGTVNVNCHQVAQTESSDASTAQGTLAAYAVGGNDGLGYVASFAEHGYIMTLVSVRADLTYQEGIPRMFSRSTMYDFYFPVFAHLGEQAVLNKEIYFDDGTPANNDLVFGYQERWSEYRYGRSYISGQFRSNAATPLDAWHCAQEFGALPTLNSTFIQENPPFDRNIAVASEPHFIADFYFNIRHVRPMPVRSIPGYIDHF